MNIERDGKTTGRFPKYQLIVDGVDVGQVKRKVTKGRDGNLGRSQPSYDVWGIKGTECSTQEEAEKLLTERAVSFGYIGGAA